MRWRVREEQPALGTTLADLNDRLPLINLVCPNCRGPPTVIGEWHWIGGEVETQVLPQPFATDSQTTVGNPLEVLKQLVVQHCCLPTQEQQADVFMSTLAFQMLQVGDLVC